MEFSINGKGLEIGIKNGIFWVLKFDFVVRRWMKGGDDERRRW